MLIAAGQEFARATVPDTIFRSFMLANMTGLRKDCGVRGIATGTVFRRLVAKTLAKQVYEGSGARLFAFSIRIIHSGRSGLCVARSSGGD